jgi:HPt (histidine-containing phosphotransfer) domain-containing protein
VSAEVQSQAVDFVYLERFVGGDRAVVLEVLALFCEQAESWQSALQPDNPEWRNVVHTIKGASRGIGARALGDVCETAEFGSVDELPAVRAGLSEAVDAVTAYRAAAS